MSFAGKVIEFNKDLDFTGELPPGIKVMNPFMENPEINPASNAFYNKFYNDNRIRKLILGINPGRLGAGATGIPFTDTKRLSEICKIEIKSFTTHEPSSVFVYKLIDKYGGVEKFYRDYMISSICPLGFIRLSSKSNWVNCNYYESEDLFKSVKDFIVKGLRSQIDFGIDTSKCFVLGKKNAQYLKGINDKENLFGSFTVLDHPRYIEQYRSKYREEYLSQYLTVLKTG